MSTAFEQSRQHGSRGFVLVALVVCLLSLNVLVSLIRGWKGPISHVPGPWHTKFTHICLRYKVLMGQRSRWLLDMHKTYGGVVRVSPSELSVADLDATREIHKVGGGFLKTDFFRKIQPPTTDTIFSAIDPAVHSRIRRIFGGPMSESSIRKFHPLVRERAELMVTQVIKEQKALGYFDFLKWAALYSQDIISEASFGHSFRTLEVGKNSEYIKDINTCVTLGSVVVQLFNCHVSALPRLPIWPIRPLQNATHRTEEQAVRMIAAYRNTQASNPDHSLPHGGTMFFAHCLGDKGRELGFSELEIAQAASGNLIAGTDTTANALTYLLFALTQNPGVMSRLRQELAGTPTDPTYDDLRSCRYLEHVIEESLRLYGSVSTSLLRSVPVDGRTIAGYFVPGGTTVSPIAYVLHRDATIFPDPEAFRPERWDGASKDMRDAMTAFGGGARICLGLHLAKMEMRVAVWEFLRRTKGLSAAVGREGFRTEEMEMLDFFATIPKGGRCLLMME